MFELASGPRDLGEILAQGIRLGQLAFLRLFMLMSVIAFLGVIPTFCLVWGAGNQTIGFQEMLDGLHGVYGLALLIVGLLGLPLRAILLNRIAAAARGQSYSRNEELAKALHLWLRLFVAGVVLLLAVSLGFVLLLVPGLILCISLMFEEFGIVLEGYGPIQALNASHNLVWGHWWRTVGLLLMMILPCYILISIVGAMLGLDTGAIGEAGMTGRALFGQTVLEMVFAAFLGPFFYSILYVYYHDLKLRKQGA